MLNRIGVVVASTSLITLGTVGTFSLPNKALVSSETNLSSRNVDYIGSLTDLGKPKAFGIYCPFSWCRR
ncbi:MAG TPA: hypothetical protein DCP31_05670 [Cyanobacteria bacterium UBA8543]|nr:hypothetical protein [Cyanobacteria bacterium UBA8543]